MQLLSLASSEGALVLEADDNFLESCKAPPLVQLRAQNLQWPLNQLGHPGAPSSLSKPLVVAGGSCEAPSRQGGRYEPRQEQLLFITRYRLLLTLFYRFREDPSPPNRLEHLDL